MKSFKFPWSHGQKYADSDGNRQVSFWLVIGNKTGDLLSEVNSLNTSILYGNKHTMEIGCDWGDKQADIPRLFDDPSSILIPFSIGNDSSI